MLRAVLALRRAITVTLALRTIGPRRSLRRRLDDFERRRWHGGNAAP
jgi:hypothetical protein